MLSEQFRLRFSSFSRSTAASTAVEYAVCIGLIIGTIIAAGVLIGGPLKNAFLLAGTSGQPIADQSSHQSDLRPAVASAPDAGPSTGSFGLWLAICLCGIVPITGAFWFLRRRRAGISDANDGPVEAQVPRELQAKFVVKRQAILHFLSSDLQQLAHGQMAVRQIMSTSVMTRSPNDSVDELRTLMKESVIRHFLVCSPSGQLVGIVSDRDIQGRQGESVADIMTAKPITVTPETPVGTVTTIMLARRIHCVPVVEEGRLLGIVTTSDLIMALQCVLRLIEQLAAPLDANKDIEIVEPICA